MEQRLFPHRPMRALAAGLGVTLLQIFLAVLLSAPAGSLSTRYQSLVQHDSYWFASIVDHGYETILPPIARKMMEVSNVAFFPAYPALAAAVRYGLGLSTPLALLLTAQAAAWGFWSYFFLFGQRWRISRARQWLGAALIVAHPSAFFLVAAYSESLFLMMLLGFIYWSTAPGKIAWVIAALHGIGMSATRIVGIPCAAYPVVRRVFEKGWSGLRDARGWWKNYAAPVALMGIATLGAGFFFLYCLLRWGRWDLYMLTQEAGWGVQPDYLALFRPASYHWLIPPLNEPRAWSQLTMTFGAVCLLVVGLVEFIPALRQRTAWPQRIGIYFVAAMTFYISVSGVASVQMESMLRYQFCAHALIILALMHFLAEFRPLPVGGRVLGMTAAAVLVLAGLSLQGWWVWNFTRGAWVA